MPKRSIPDPGLASVKGAKAAMAKSRALTPSAARNLFAASRVAKAIARWPSVWSQAVKVFCGVSRDKQWLNRLTKGGLQALWSGAPEPNQYPVVDRDWEKVERVVLEETVLEWAVEIAGDDVERAFELAILKIALRLVVEDQQAGKIKAPIARCGLIVAFITDLLRISPRLTTRELMWLSVYGTHESPNVDCHQLREHHREPFEGATEHDLPKSINAALLLEEERREVAWRQHNQTAQRDKVRDLYIRAFVELEDASAKQTDLQSVVGELRKRLASRYTDFEAAIRQRRHAGRDGGEWMIAFGIRSTPVSQPSNAQSQRDPIDEEFARESPKSAGAAPPIKRKKKGKKKPKGKREK